jgi:hypothetical protein
MARARNIKPGFFTNEELAELSFEARLLFVGLWLIADKEGRLEDRPKKIKAEIFPYDNVDCDDLLQRLHEKNFIARYKPSTSLVLAQGKPEEKYIQIINFVKHQNPHHREKNSTIPEFSESLGLAQGKPRSSPKPAVLNPESLKLNPESIGNPISTKPENEKIKYAEFVSMTEKEYNSLSSQFGEEGTLEMVKILDDYKGANPKKRTYESDFRAIHSWVVKRYQDEFGKIREKESWEWD